MKARVSVSIRCSGNECRQSLGKPFVPSVFMSPLWCAEEFWSFVVCFSAVFSTDLEPYIIFHLIVLIFFNNFICVLRQILWKLPFCVRCCDKHIGKGNPCPRILASIWKPAERYPCIYNLNYAVMYSRKVCLRIQINLDVMQRGNARTGWRCSRQQCLWPEASCGLL